MSRPLVVALAGNPNSGKTSLFNALTGARQHVGNYPGVTVEKREGQCRHGDRDITIVDLPGAYSLTAYSPEELAARHFLIEERPDVVVDVVDASNLERNLYLAVQLMELGLPLVLAFNMSDRAKARGLEFDLPQLSELLGAPIVPTIGHQGKGLRELLGVIETVADRPEVRPPHRFEYDPELNDAVDALEERLRGRPELTGRYGARWLALKLMENDAEVCKLVDDPVLKDEVRRRAEEIEKIRGMPPEHLIADHRYGFISGACQEAVRAGVEARHTMSDRIDSVVTNRVLGLPVFLGLMYAVFLLTFTLGEPPMHWIETGVEWLGARVSALWPPGSESPLRSLLADGIIAGVGGVLVFLPNILLLFLAIAFLEDTGYMARAAFLMDRLMHKIGLHGKSFIPMLIGFGCTVPGVLATRVLETRRDRLTTMLVLPLMSCGARLPIYMLIIPAFFPPHWRAPILWIIYLIGIGLAIGLARLLRGTLFRGDSMPFVMELPPYHMPTWRGMLLHMWKRGGLYLRKAGTLILGISIVMWALTSYPKLDRFPEGLSEEARQAEALAHTAAGRIGHAIEPALRPLGFDWRIGTAMIGAFAAKEVFVAQLGIVYAVGSDEEAAEPLRAMLARQYTPLTGLCIMLFMLIAMPCMATFAVVRRESGSWKWAVLQSGSLTILAYLITGLVYQGGRLLGLGL
ncbi:MAG: ferrous iron transport protein B [Verrucomicrobia bacterium]|nr:ferrous iron transport protein B [Verrucomicrobiota bacterium]